MQVFQSVGEWLHYIHITKQWIRPFWIWLSLWIKSMKPMSILHTVHLKHLEYITAVQILALLFLGSPVRVSLRPWNTFKPTTQIKVEIKRLYVWMNKEHVCVWFPFFSWTKCQITSLQKIILEGGFFNKNNTKIKGGQMY